jgi:hypothetical protein
MTSLRHVNRLILGVVLAAPLVVGTTAAHADTLSISPSLASLRFDLGSQDDLGEFDDDDLGGLKFSLLGGAQLAGSTFSAPVGSVSVLKQGPGPIHVDLAASAGLQLSFSNGTSLRLTGLAFDVGTRVLSGDLSLTVPTAPCRAEVCAAVFSANYDFNDLPLLTAGKVSGNIDGGMPLDQALAVPTLKAQQLTLDADVFFNFAALSTVAARVGLSLPAVALEPIPVGHFSITSVPESSTLAMLGLGLAGLAVVARRRQA